MVPTKSERLYPLKFEMCRQDVRCSYRVSDIPDKLVEK
jgi:hypothetical protein